MKKLKNFLFATLLLGLLSCTDSNFSEIESIEGLNEPTLTPTTINRVQDDEFPPTLCGQNLHYRKFSGDAIDVAANENFIFKVAANKVVYAYRPQDDRWISLGGQARRIAVDGSNWIWITNDKNEIYRSYFNGFSYTIDRWEKMSGKATDIAADHFGIVHILGDREIGGEYDVYRRSGNGWTKIGGRGRRISGGSTADAWLVNKNNDIYKRENNAWVKIPGKARDIAEGAGSLSGLYIVGNTSKGADGYDVYTFDYENESWCKVRGIGTNIAVRNGMPLVSNGLKKMYAGCQIGSDGFELCPFF